jgi:hypothetical protein
MTYRRPLVRPCALAYAKAYAEARADLSAMHFQYECRMADLTRALEQTRSELDALRDVVRRRVAAERELANLHALRDAEPAFGQLLN